MTDIEQLIRATMRDHADALPPTDLGPGRKSTADRHRHTRHRWVASAAASVVVLAIAATLALANRAPSRRSTPPASTTESIAPRPSLTPLTPILPTGNSTCGDYGIVAVTARATTPLVSCAGLAGMTQSPSVTVGVGDEVTISGLADSATLTPSPESILRQQATTFLAIRPGTVAITVHGASCVPLKHRQPTTCQLVTIIVR